MLSKYEVYPQEFSDMITISLTATAPGNFIIALVDVEAAKIIRMVGAEVKVGDNTILFEGLQALPASNYLVTIKSNDGNDIYKIPLIKRL
jgi:hypothetical protein